MLGKEMKLKTKSFTLTYRSK